MTYWIRGLVTDLRNVSLKSKLGGGVVAVLVRSLFMDALQLLEEHCCSS